MRDLLERERVSLTKEKQKYKELWNVYCARSMRDDALISERENELGSGSMKLVLVSVTAARCCL